MLDRDFPARQFSTPALMRREPPTPAGSRIPTHRPLYLMRHHVPCRSCVGNGICRKTPDSPVFIGLPAIQVKLAKHNFPVTPEVPQIMPKPLTPKKIANLRPSAAARGAGPRLQRAGVVVHPSRRKCFIVQFRFRACSRKLTLGPCLTEAAWSRPTRRRSRAPCLVWRRRASFATKALREAKAGTDPCAAKKQKRQQAAAAESDTLSAIGEEYLRREGERLRTVKQREADLKLLTESALGRLPVASISRGQFARVLDESPTQRGPVRSDRCAERVADPVDVARRPPAITCRRWSKVVAGRHPLRSARARKPSRTTNWGGLARG